jgi:hypothetical protein
LNPISVRKATAFAFIFLRTQLGALLGIVLLPALLGWVVLYVSVEAYLVQLEWYLRNPNDREASVVLGLIAAGILLGLFLHSVLIIAVAELALRGPSERGWLKFRVRRQEWRLYAATLRFLMITTTALVLLYVLLHECALLFPIVGAQDWFKPVMRIALLTALFVMAVRFAFLIPPIVLEERGQIIRRSWKLSGGIYWRLIATVLILLGPAIVLQIGGEFVLRTFGNVPSIPASPTLLDITVAFHSVLPAFLGIFALSYVISAVLLTAGSTQVYRSLVLGRA